MNRRKRIGIYGGTFDPVHLGHLEVARQVARLFEFDEILFVPAQVAPHKQQTAVTAAIHRYAMLALATQSEPRLRISAYELEAPDRGYTVDTLKHFRAASGDSVDIFFLMGADSWMEITTWREWERVLSMASHIVVTRPGYELSTEHVGPAVAARVHDLRKMNPAEIANALLDKDGDGIYVSDAAKVDVSATGIRQAVTQAGFDSLTALVPAAVADYIQKYGLYREFE